MSRISNQALLAKLTTHAWSGQKKDSEVSRRVAANAQADPASASFYKRLAKSHLFEEFQRTATAAREYHNRVTLPWLDGGYRLLPTGMFFDYQKTMAGYRDEARGTAKRIESEYPRIVEQARARLGTLYNEADFPTAEKVAASFGIEVSLIPVPDTEDFRLDLDEQTQENIRNEVQQSYKEMERKAMLDLWSRLEAVVEHVSERLHAVNKAERKRLHESVVGHVRDLVEILPSMNVSGDGELDTLAREAKDKLLVDIQALRTSPDKREETAQAADDLLARITGAKAQR